MSTVSKPVITDETGKKLVAAIEGLALREGANKEILEEIKAGILEISGKMGGKIESEVSIFDVTETLDTGASTVVVGEEGYMDGVTYENVKNAFDQGKHVFLRVATTRVSSDGAATFAGSSLVPLVEVTSYAMTFFSHGITIKGTSHVGMYMLSANDKFTYNNQKIGSSGVACSVTIGGTKYETLDKALAALAALHEG